MRRYCGQLYPLLRRRQIGQLHANITDVLLNICAIYVYNLDCYRKLSLPKEVLCLSQSNLNQSHCVSAP